MKIETNAPASPRAVAEWLISELEEVGYLTQKEAVAAIQSRFGSEFVYLDVFDNLAISRKVLYQFRKLRSDRIVWEISNNDWFNGWWRMLK